MREGKMKLTAQDVSEPIVKITVQATLSEARELMAAFNYIDRMLPDGNVGPAVKEFSGMILLAVSRKLFVAGPEEEEDLY